MKLSHALWGHPRRAGHGGEKCSTWMQSQKRQNDLCFQDKPFTITVIQVYDPTTNAEEAEAEWFYEDLQPSRTNTPKRCLQQKSPKMQYVVAISKTTE